MNLPEEEQWQMFFVWNCVIDEVVTPENSHVLFEALCKKAFPVSLANIHKGVMEAGSPGASWRNLGFMMRSAS